MSKGKKWTSLEDEMLRKYTGKIPTKKLAKKLNRSVASVNSRKNRLGLFGKYTPWTSDEIEILKQLYPITNTKRLSELLNRSVDAIQQKTSTLGIRKDDEPRLDSKKKDQSNLKDLIEGICPNCKGPNSIRRTNSIVNTEYGLACIRSYFCSNCLTEYSNLGVEMSPME